MTTATELITQALRESNVIPIGTAPSTAQLNEALPRLNNYIESLFGTKLGEFFFMDWPVPPRQTSPVNARYPLAPADTKLPRNVWPYLPNNVRIVASPTEATTIYLPRKPNDGARIGLADVGSTADLTIDANGRYIEGVAVLTLTPADDAPREWFYRADLGTWQRRAPLALTDESPFPAEFDDLLVTGLAIRLGPRFGKRPPQETAITNQRMERRLKQRYKQLMPKDGGFNPEYYSRQAHGMNDRAPYDSSLYRSS